MKAKYVNPFTDFGFKKIFGEEANKLLLLDFLNALLPLQSPIRDLSFRNVEKLGRTIYQRKAIFDIYCENERGEKFIVELQKEFKDFFIERTIYYSTFPIAEQAQKGDWDFNLKAVFCIGILDFTFSDYENDNEKNRVRHVVKLKDQNGRTFYDKLTYVYLEMPNFNKQEDELVTRLDKWLYFIKHLEDFRTIPDIFKGEVVFEQAFEKAALARFDDSEWEYYEGSLKVYRDINNTMNSAIRKAKSIGREEGREEGWEEGRVEGRMEGRMEGKEEGFMEGLMEVESEVAAGRIALRMEVAKKLKTSGIPIEIIIKTTGIIPEVLGNL